MHPFFSLSESESVLAETVPINVNKKKDIWKESNESNAVRARINYARSVSACNVTQLHAAASSFNEIAIISLIGTVNFIKRELR